VSEQRILVWLLVEQDGAVLLSQRKADEPPFAGQWTLPGEEMPGSESASETVGRFGREQLDIRIAGEEFADTVYLEESDLEYAANVFRIVAYEGRPRFRESGPYTEVRWVVRDEFQDEQAYVMPGPLRTSLISILDRE
jgi:ADP-ribose pyrophosphatase YjhB (NUDIX family)